MMLSASSVEQLPIERELRSRRLPLGPGVLLGCMGSQVACAPLGRLMVRARLVGPVAAVEVIQSFQNNQAEPIEFYYLFPVSQAGSISKFRAQVGQRVCDWQVVPKEQAANLAQPTVPPFLGNLFEGEYQTVFCVPLGLVQPGEVVNIDLAYAELLSSVGGDFRFSFPLLLSSRFQTGANTTPEAGSDALGLTPGLVAGPNFALSVALEVAGAAPLKLASSHPLVTHQLPSGELGFELARQDLPARDFTLTYRLGHEKNPQGILRQGRQHFLYHLHPPLSCPPTTTPRHLILLLDVSDNAQGGRLEAAKQVAGQLLQSIGPGELFSLVAFNHQLSGYETGIPCDKSHVGEALRWLSALKASGRADMSIILERVLQLALEPGRSTVVAVIASGKLGNEPELYSTLTSNPSQIRFNSIGIDQAVNHSFLRRLSGYTRGQCTFLGLEAPDEVTQQKLIQDTKGPLLTDVQLVDQGLGINVETFTPGILPGLPLADVVSVIGLKAGTGGIEARARSFSGHPWIEAVVPAVTQNPALGVVWAHHKAREMSDELRLTSGPNASRLRELSSSLSKDYRLVGDFTASVLADPAVEGGAVILPSLLTGEWKPTEVIDLTKNTGGRFASGRIQLPPPPPIEELPPRPPSEEAMSEPAQVLPHPVEADEAPISNPGLRAKVAILSDKPKHDVKPKLTGGMKSEAQTKPMMGSGRMGRMPGGKPVLRQEARRAGIKEPEIEAETQQPKRLPQPNKGVGAAKPPEEVKPEPPPPVEPAPPPPAPPPVTPPPQASPPTVQGSGEVEVTPEAQAKQLLSQDLEFRTAMMTDLKAIYQTLAKCAQAGGAIDPQLLPLLERVLRRLQPLMAQSALLKEAYRIGVLCYQAVRGQDPQALAKTQHWVQRFAKLF